MTIDQAKTLTVGTKIISATGKELVISYISADTCNLYSPDLHKTMWANQSGARWTDANLAKVLAIMEYSLDNLFAPEA